MTVIDADGHVLEPPAMFSPLEKEYYGRRPLPLKFDAETVLGKWNAVWFIDGKTYPKLFGRGRTIFSKPTIMKRAQEKQKVYEGSRGMF